MGERKNAIPWYLRITVCGLPKACRMQIEPNKTETSTSGVGEGSVLICLNEVEIKLQIDPSA